MTLDLVLNHRSLDAEEAHRLKLITHVSDEGAVADAVQYARGLAARPATVLKTLAKAAMFPECDFETYLRYRLPKNSSKPWLVGRYSFRSPRWFFPNCPVA